MSKMASGILCGASIAIAAICVVAVVLCLNWVTVFYHLIPWIF